jgi:putative aldouronate transport system substrate-binding protein
MKAATAAIRWRITLTVTLLCIIAFVSACNGQHRSAASDPAPPAISFMVPLSQPQPPSAESIGRLEKLTGTSLKIDWISNDNYTEKMVNALETNTLKQVTYVNGADYGLVKNSIRSDMFWEIGPYLDDYPNLNRLKREALDETKVDGKIYGLFSERPPSRQGLIIRKDWLDKLGLKEPGTLDELYHMLVMFTRGDPDGNGKNDTIGLADRNDLIFGAFKTFSSYFGAPNNWGLVNGKLSPEFMSQEYIDTMNFMKKLYDEKLVNADFPVTSKQIQRYMLITGKAGAVVGAMDDAQRLQEQMRKTNPNAELTLVNRIRGPEGYGIWSIPDYSGVFLFSKKAIPSERDLRTILQFFDRTMDPDVGNFLKFGQEGKHYTVQDSKVVMNQTASESFNQDIRPLYSLMIANLSNPNLLKPSDKDQDRLMLLANKLAEDNESFLIRDPTVGLSSMTNDAQGATIAPIIANATYNYILGKIDLAGFQKEIAAWKQSGGDAITAEFNAAYADKNK